MINNEKHMIGLGRGDVDMETRPSPGGNPVVIFSNKGWGIGPDSAYLGFASAESLDSFIAFLQQVKRDYYPQPLSHTQRFYLEE